MDLTTLDKIELPPTADFHSHLRDGAMMEVCTPLIEAGGCDTAFVMPNLQPPIVTTAQATAYYKKLQALAPNVKFLMSLYLHPSLTPDEIAEAAKSKVVYGVKLYRAGVTTNSQDGVLNIEQFYPVFAAMQKHGLVLNLHGEMASSPPRECCGDGLEAVTVLNAEPKFLPQLEKLHKTFPSLRIVLEHVSTREGLDAVRRCGATVAGTITAHHLWMTIDDWCGDVFSYCKPVAKTPADRIALIKAVVEGSGKFFFGSDSAPHQARSKTGPGNTPAGCFTQPYCTALVIGALEEAIRNGWIESNHVNKAKLEGFLSEYGRSFYQLPSALETKARIALEKRGEVIPDSILSADSQVEIVPFKKASNMWSVIAKPQPAT